MIGRVCQVLNATPVEEAELVGAAEFSSSIVRIPIDSAPEVYPMLHRLAATAPALSKEDISTLEKVVSRLMKTRVAGPIGRHVSKKRLAA